MRDVAQRVCYRSDGSTGRCSLLPCQACSMVVQVLQASISRNWEIYFIFDMSSCAWVWLDVKVGIDGFSQVQIPSGSFHERLVGSCPQMVQILCNRWNIFAEASVEHNSMRILTLPRKRNAVLSTRTLDRSATRKDEQTEKWASIKNANVSCRPARVYDTLSHPLTKHTEGLDQSYPWTCPKA